MMHQKCSANNSCPARGGAALQLVERAPFPGGRCGRWAVGAAGEQELGQPGSYLPLKAERPPPGGRGPGRRSQRPGPRVGVAVGPRHCCVYRPGTERWGLQEWGPRPHHGNAAETADSGWGPELGAVTAPFLTGTRKVTVNRQTGPRPQGAHLPAACPLRGG